MKMWMLPILVVVAAGCDSVRFAPTENQKQNAWSHMNVTRVTAQEARAADSSERVCSLASLGARQAEAFAADYGMPKEMPKDGTAEELLTESNWVKADLAVQDSQRRPDGWSVADNVLELGAGLAGLLGGVYGTRLVRFANEARQKSKALKEIVEGNELFKKLNPSAVEGFKDAHSSQSLDTRQLVASLK